MTSEKATCRAWISQHRSGRAGLQPRRYKAFLIIPVSRAPRSPDASGLRGARDEERVRAAISAGLKPRPSRTSGPPHDFPRGGTRGHEKNIILPADFRASDLGEPPAPAQGRGYVNIRRRRSSA